MGNMSHNELLRFEDRGHEALMGVWWAGVQLKKGAKRFFGDYLSSEAQFNIMMALKYADGPLTQNELGGRLLVEKSNVTGLLDRMERDGLLRRLKVPGDRRSHHIELTEAGRRTLEKVELPYRRHVQKLMSTFTEAEIANITDYMARLQKAVAATEPTVADYQEEG